MSWLFPSVVATMVGTLLLVFLYYYLYFQDRNKYMLIWAISWSIYFFRFIFLLFIIAGNRTEILLIFNQMSSLVSGIFLLWGTHIFIEKKFSKLWIAAVVAGCIWIIFSIFFKFTFLIMSIPTFFFLAIVNVYTGIMLISAAKEPKNERWITGFAFILWGIHKADYPFLRPIIWFAPWGYLLGAVFEFIVAIGIVLLYFRRTKDMLRDSTLHMRAVIETIPDLVWLKDPDGVYLSCNPKFERLFGAKESDIVGKTDYDFVDAELATFFQEKDKSAMAAQKPSINEEEVTYADDGHKEILETIKTPMYDSMGRLIGVLGIARDITKLKQTEKEIREEKEFTETALNSQQDTFFLFERDTGKAIRWNKAFSEITGYTDDEIANMKAPQTYYSQEDLNRIATFVEKILKKGIGTIELNLICKDGHNVPTEYSVSVINGDDDTPKYLITIGRDISDRKQMEDELRQAHKMESIGTLAGGIAHDFNNILSIIVGNTELALDDLSDWNPSYTNLLEIKTASLRAKDVVRQLLSFSRKTGHEQKSLDITKVIKESIQLIRSSIPSSIEIRENIPETIEPILADATQIHQVLINLCTNASHSMMEDGGVLEIILRPMVLTEHTDGIFKDLVPGSYLELIIKDTGSGIEPNIFNKIYDPYFTTKDVGKGTGMGLAVVLGIVKNHKGEIFVDSEPGNGTTFTIIFPTIAEPPQQKRSENFNIAINSSGKETVLFVDDEESLTDMAEIILTKIGYSVKTCTDPIDALAVFKKEPDGFDLVITDMTMPQMSGVKLSKKLRELRPDLPIIICTGHSSLIDEEKANALGISAFAMKPVMMSEMAKLIRTVLEK